MKYIPSSSYVSPGGQSAIPKMVQKRRTFHIFGFIATILLLGSLLSAGGVFFYKNELEKQLAEARNALSQQSTKDNEKNISDIESFHLKLKTAELLLENHRAPSKLFVELEKVTKKKVQLTSLKYTYDPGFEAALELEGRTEELSSVALQKMKLIDESLFSVFTIEGITSSLDTLDTKATAEKVSEDQKVGFGVKGLLREGIITYDGGSTITAPDTIETTEQNVSTTSEASSEPIATTTDNEVTP